MDEFDFIRYLSKSAGDSAEGLADDCAWVPGDRGWLVVSTDTSLEGVHFPTSVKGAAATERAVRVAASDIAAKGCEPLGMFVALSAPKAADHAMMQAYALGISEASDVLSLPLLGGDTTRHDGRLSITVTVMGRARRKVLRSGAKVGDALYVSHEIGSAHLGLKLLMGDPVAADGRAFVEWEEAFLRPQVDFELGRSICAAATATVDCSDGLLADAAHIALQSGVRLEIDAARVPLSEGSGSYARTRVAALQELVTAGDDYAIIFTGPEGMDMGYKIGRVTEGKGVSLIQNGRDITPARLGYRH